MKSLRNARRIGIDQNDSILIAMCITALVVAIYFIQSDDRQPVVVYAEYIMQGGDPGTAVDDTLTLRGLVRYVEVDGKRYNRKWYLENYDNLRLVDLIWIEPQFNERDESLY